MLQTPFSKDAVRIDAGLGRTQCQGSQLQGFAFMQANYLNDVSTISTCFAGLSARCFSPSWNTRVWRFSSFVLEFQNDSRPQHTRKLLLSNVLQTTPEAFNSGVQNLQLIQPGICQTCSITASQRTQTRTSLPLSYVPMFTMKTSQV